MKSKVKAVIDRLEGDKAVLLVENSEQSFDLPLSLLPEGAGEGDIVTLKIKAEKDRTKKAKAEAQDLIKKLTSRF